LGSIVFGGLEEDPEDEDSGVMSMAAQMHAQAADKKVLKAAGVAPRPEAED